MLHISKEKKCILVYIRQQNTRRKPCLFSILPMFRGLPDAWRLPPGPIQSHQVSVPIYIYHILPTILCPMDTYLYTLTKPLQPKIKNHNKVSKFSQLTSSCSNPTPTLLWHDQPPHPSKTIKIKLLFRARKADRKSLVQHYTLKSGYLSPHS